MRFGTQWQGSDRTYDLWMEELLAREQINKRKQNKDLAGDGDDCVWATD